MGYVLAAYALVLSCLVLYGLHLGAERARLMGRGSRRHAMLALGWLGLLLGGFVGILLRPSLPPIGPLPLDAVFSRGAGLSGGEAGLADEARKAFDRIVLTALLGAAAGAAAAALLVRRRRARIDPPPAA